MDYIDQDVQTAWIAEHTNLPIETVSGVLAVENEYMARVGIAAAPHGYEFRFSRRVIWRTVPEDGSTCSTSPKSASDCSASPRRGGFGVRG